MAEIIATERLFLRAWRESDLSLFHAMGQDPEVMRFIGDPPTMEENRAAMERQNAILAEHGHCFWAVERRDTGEFIGFCGLKPGAAGTPIAEDVEIGWRIARPHWRRGFAYEAACASLVNAWARGIPAAAAITVPANRASWGLMEKLGMRRDPHGDFDHPALPEGHPLRRHLTYRIDRPA